MFESALRLFEDDLQKAELSLAPMVDMIFILIIFFAIATTFTRHKGIHVEKSFAKSAAQVKDHSVMITIDRNGNYWFEGEARPLPQIEKMIFAKSGPMGKPPPVTIVPDKNGRIDPLIHILDHLRLKSIREFSLGTETREKTNLAKSKTRTWK